MNVLFHCWEYPPTGSGIGRYVEGMSAALRDAGHRTVVLTSRAAGFPECEPVAGGRVLRLFERSEMRSMRVARLVVEAARQHGADWIEVADHWGEGATLLSLRDRPPVVVKMHYNDVLKTPRHAQAWYPWQKSMIDLACVRQWRSIRAERYGVERADMLLAPCQRILDEAERQGVALPARRAVVPNPIRPIPGWNNQEAGAPTLLLVGRLDMGKGLPHLKRMLEQLSPGQPGLRVEIAGGDSYARGLGSIRGWFERQLGPMRRHVHFLGVLGAAELDEAYRRAWVVMVPSRWDTFPQVVLEAMVRAKAIVASPHGGMPEMLAGTACAVADPAADAFAGAVAAFLASPTSRRQAGESARQRAAREYAPEQIAKKYLGTISAWL